MLAGVLLSPWCKPSGIPSQLEAARPLGASFLTELLEREFTRTSIPVPSFAGYTRGRLERRRGRQKQSDRERVVSNEDQESFKEKFLELEYNALRKEIEVIRDRHFKISAGALLIIPGVQIFAKVSEASGSSAGSSAFTLAVLAPLPIAVLTLYLLYFSEHAAMGRCARYIREEIECEVDGGGWETWLHDQKDKGIRTYERQGVIAVSTLYLGLYVIGTILAVVQVHHAITYWDSIAAYARLGVFGAIAVYAIVLLYVISAVRQLMKRADYVW